MYYIKTYASPVGNPFQLPYGAGVLLPPVIEHLLAWNKGPTIAGDIIEWGDPTIEWGDDSLDWGYHRRDYHTDLGNFPMRLSQSNCATGVATTDNILLGNCPWGTFQEGVSFSAEAEVLNTATNYLFGDWVVDVGGFHIERTATSFIVSVHTTGSNTPYEFLDSASGVSVGEVVSVLIDFEHVSGDTYNLVATIGGYAFASQSVTMGDVAVDNQAYLMNRGTDFSFRGKLSNAKLYEGGVLLKHYPLAEGSGATVHSTDGDSATVATSDSTAFWVGRQDNHHFNVINGFWSIDSDPVKYPYEVSGYDSYSAAGNWGAETLQTYPELTDIVTADALGTGPFFFDGVGVAVARSTDEIIVHARTSDIFMYSDTRGARHYNEVLAGSELDDAVLFGGTDIIITFDGASLTFDGDPLYMR